MPEGGSSAAQAEEDRRRRLGEPVVRDERRQGRGWVFVCPYPEDYLTCEGSLYEGCDTAEECFARWVEHARSAHPGRPASWPAGVPGACLPDVDVQLDLFGVVQAGLDAQAERLGRLATQSVEGAA